MSAGRSFSCLHLLKASIPGLLILLFASCTIVKKYPVNKPFVYKTNINLIGNFSNEEKANLTDGLKGQLDDSLRARRLDKLAWKVLKHPPVYDSTNADKSLIFMKALLISLGYFDDSITYRDSIIPKGSDQLQTTVTFDVAPRRQWRLDTIVYNIGNEELQKLADSTKKEALIKKGDPFAKAPISAEIDRLTELYRNNGYLRFGRDELVAVWDTLDVALLKPTLDPFEQLKILGQLRERKKQPTANLEFQLRTKDSAKLTKYYNGIVTIYPDYTIDTFGLVRKVAVDTMHKITVVQHRNKFRPKIFPPNVYLPHDSLYRLRRYIRTVNRLNSLGTWRLVNIDQIPRKDQDTVDYIIRLTPAKKFSFTTNLEGSINQSAISGRLFGIGINVGLQNRNFAKAANFDSWNARYGIELGGTAGNQFIQTQQFSLSRSIIFPRAIIIDKWIKESLRDNLRSSLSGNITNTERRLLYNQTTINAALGYEFQRRNLLLAVKLPNIEYSVLKKRPDLVDLLNNNPSLRNIFTDGFIASLVNINISVTGGTTKSPHITRINVEEAGLFAGLIPNRFFDTNLYRFIKTDFEFAKLIRLPKSSIALRGFFGIGYEFDFTVNPLKRNTLPFFKQYFSGGPNSMRAWALRRLGPGSTIKDFGGKDGTPDRYGDVQLEVNAEYRFPIGKPLGIKVDGAFFTDIGNVWLLKKQAGPPEEVFNFSRLGKDIAIGAGGGLRIDFGFFVIRLDYSYKVKDPSPSLGNAALQNKLFAYPFFKGAQFQLGIGYPFIF
jgi:outer membrane protein insertion porin family